MSWLTKTFSSSIGRKVLMSISGLFLTIFLIGHLVGNLQLLVDDGGIAFNEYAYFMMHNPGIQVVAWITKVAILAHIAWAFMLTAKNKAARPVAYAMNKASANSHWTSRNMLPFGIVLFVFIVIHLIDFWAKAHYGQPEMVTIGGVEMVDLYSIVQQKFQTTWVVLFYVIAMAFISFHLWHGVKSGFQSLGINHKKYNPIIANISAFLAILLPVGFAIIPLYMYLKF